MTDYEYSHNHYKNDHIDPCQYNLISVLLKHVE